MEIVRGTIYVAPPDRHLLLHRDRVAVVKGPKENGHRPSVDSLFRSAAQHFGPMATGIILSGSLDDGTAGLMAIKRKGGTAIAQDPADALFSGMPNSAIQSVDVDHVLPVDEIPALLSRRMARNAHLKRHQSTAARFDAEAVLSEEQAVRLRTLLLSRDSGAVDSEPRFESRNPPSTPRNGGSGGREESSSLPNPD
jgi:two-component system chemotaxis response regulator CheB